MTTTRDVDLRDARRRLLRRPLLHAEHDPDGYATAVRVLAPLRRWFQEHLEWVVEHDPQARVVRLYKVAPDPLPQLPVTAEVRLSPRRVAVALVVAAVLDERQRAQWDVVSLRDEVVALCRSRDDLPELDPASNHRHRSDLWAALRWLIEDLGVLKVRDGDAERAVSDHGTTNAVLDHVHGSTERLLPRQLDFAGGRQLHRPDPSSAAVEETRRFVDRPALFDHDLGGFDPGRRGRLAQLLASRCRDLGLELEARREGFAGIDTEPATPLAPVAFPFVRSTAAHCALLLAEQLGAAARDTDQTRTHEQLVAAVTELDQRHARSAGWSRRQRDDLDGLTTEAVTLLVSVDLLRRNTDGTVTTTPLICRYAAQGDQATATDAGSSLPTLLQLPHGADHEPSGATDPSPDTITTPNTSTTPAPTDTGGAAHADRSRP